MPTEAAAPEEEAAPSNEPAADAPEPAGEPTPEPAPEEEAVTKDDPAPALRQPGDQLPDGTTAIRVYTKDGRENHNRAGRIWGSRPQTVPMEALTRDEFDVLDYCPVLAVEFVGAD